MIGALAPTAMWFTDPSTKHMLWDATPGARHLNASSGTFGHTVGVPGRFGGAARIMTPDSAPQWMVPSARQGIFDNVANTVGNSKGFTVWAWVYMDPAASTPEGSFFAKNDNNSINIGWAFLYRNSPFFVVERASTNFFLTTSVTPAVGAWFHICMTFDPTTITGHAYINGVDVSSLTTAGSGTQGSDTGEPLSVLSVNAKTAFGVTDPFHGAVDHVAIDCSRIYGAAEVKDLYQRPFRMFRTQPWIIGAGSAASGSSKSQFLFGT